MIDLQAATRTGTAAPAEAPPGTDPGTPLRPGDLDAPWVLAAIAGSVGAERRAELAALLDAPADTHAGRRVVVATCHRVEVYGRGPLGSLEAGLARADGVAFDAGEPAIRHLFRLAAGLESAVVGEDQILGQVRAALEAARRRGRLDPVLGRLFESALRVGRLARSGAAGQPRSLAEPALDWIAARAGGLEGRPILVVGTGRMARVAVRAAVRRGAIPVVAGRDAGRAAELAGPSGEAVELERAIGRVPEAAGIVVALAAPWHAATDLASAAVFPPVVDLSSPPALPGSLRAALGPRHLGIDDLFRSRAHEAGGGEYEGRAALVVDAAVERFTGWLAGRPAVPVIRAIRSRAEARRAAAVERLLRRLPDLTDRERALVEQLSSQLVAAILHEPSAVLRDDRDGSLAATARRLFRIG